MGAGGKGRASRTGGLINGADSEMVDDPRLGVQMKSSQERHGGWLRTAAAEEDGQGVSPRLDLRDLVRPVHPVLCVVVAAARPPSARCLTV